MEITGNRNIICRLPFQLPKKWLDKAYKSLMINYNKNANSDKIKQIITTNASKLNVYSRLMSLEILEKLIKISAITGNNDIVDDLYNEYYGAKPKNKDDFDKPFKDKQLLIQKSQQIFGNNEEDEEETKDVDIKILIRNIETILGKENIRLSKFYLLAGYINDAAKLNQKSNG
jgi:hypothetical protein